MHEITWYYTELHAAMRNYMVSHAVKRNDEEIYACSATTASTGTGLSGKGSSEDDRTSAGCSAGNAASVKQLEVGSVLS